MDNYLQINQKQTFYLEKAIKIIKTQIHFSKMSKMMVFLQNLSKFQHLSKKILFLQLKKGAKR